MSGTTPAPGAGTIPHCYRHPGRETYISCQRCGRPICPDCMRQASVGFQCPDCVKQAAATTRTVRTSLGGRMTGGSAVATISVIAINVAVFVIANASGGFNGAFGRAMSEIPDASRYSPALGLHGVAQGGYWELVTSTFLHFEILHIGMNMLGLWIFGTFLESELGRWRFVCLYLLTGVVGSVAVYWLADPTSISFGASGSVFGLFGAAFVILLKQRRDVTQLVVLLALNLFISFTVPHISWQAHVGGLLSGAALGAGFAFAPRERRQVVHVAMLTATAALVVILTAARTAVLTA